MLILNSKLGKYVILNYSYICSDSYAFHQWLICLFALHLFLPSVCFFFILLLTRLILCSFKCPFIYHLFFHLSILLLAQQLISFYGFLIYFQIQPKRKVLMSKLLLHWLYYIYWPLLHYWLQQQLITTYHQTYRYLVNKLIPLPCQKLGHVLPSY